MIPRGYLRGYPVVPARAKLGFAPWFALLVIGLGVASDHGVIDLHGLFEASALPHHRTHRPAKPTRVPDPPPLGPALGDVVHLALAQAKRMHASHKVTLALIEAGIVESNLRNLDYGDRDSLGFLQQRPSQGWHHPRNVTYATWDFCRRAIPIQGDYPTAGQLAQAVQRSAFPARYDQHAAQAEQVIRSYQQGGR
jgi:hypothetical protein